MASLLLLDAQLYRWAAQFRSAEIGRPILASVIVDPDGVISATDGYRAIAIPGAASWLSGPRRVLIRGPFFPGKMAKDLTISIPNDIDEPQLCSVHCDGKSGQTVIVEDGDVAPDIRGRIEVTRAAWSSASLRHHGKADDHMRLDTSLGDAFVFTERRGKTETRHLPQLRWRGAEESVLVTYTSSRALGIWAPCKWANAVVPEMDTDDAWLAAYSPPAVSSY